MLEIIAIIILISSIFGMGVIVYRKILILSELSEFAEKSAENDFSLKTKEKIKNIPILKFFSFKKTSFLFVLSLVRVFEKYLQKILSKIRVLSLKIDSKTFNWLQKLRMQASKTRSVEEEMQISSLVQASKAREEDKSFSSARVEQSVGEEHEKNAQHSLNKRSQKR